MNLLVKCVLYSQSWKILPAWYNYDEIFCGREKSEPVVSTTFSKYWSNNLTGLCRSVIELRQGNLGLQKFGHQCFDFTVLSVQSNDVASLAISTCVQSLTPNREQRVGRGKREGARKAGGGVVKLLKRNPSSGTERDAKNGPISHCVYWKAQRSLELTCAWLCEECEVDDERGQTVNVCFTK